MNWLATRYGRQTAQKLVDVAKRTISSGVALSARSTSLRILCDQLEHTQANLNQLEQQIEALLDQDPTVKGVLLIPEFGVMTVAVLRAELGDLDRFARMDQVVAYVGLDLEVKKTWQIHRADQTLQAGKWPGAPHPVLGRLTQHLATRLPLWDRIPTVWLIAA